MTEATRIRVLLVDDHELVREGLRVLLDGYDDITIVAEANDGDFAVQACKEHCPDVVLMDIVMPQMDGITAAQKILEICPETQIVALTSLSDEESIKTMLEAGAIGYILKDVSGADLVNAVREAHSGETTLSSEATQALIRLSTRPPQPGHDLTDRERDVLRLMAEGLSNREIAQQLVISSSTVKNHVSSIMGKMNAKSRTHTVALALENKVLE